jgi:hypothetical protein
VGVIYVLNVGQLAPQFSSDIALYLIRDSKMGKIYASLTVRISIPFESY